MKPKWQRARIIYSRIPAIIGTEIWARLGPPVITGWYDVLNFEEHPPEPCFYENLLDQTGRPMVTAASRIELLARSEDDFAEEVELIPWETFLESCRRAQPSP